MDPCIIDDGSRFTAEINSYEDLRQLVRKKKARWRPFEEKLLRCWRRSEPGSKERTLILKIVSNFENRRWKTYRPDEIKLKQIESTGKIQSF